MFFLGGDDFKESERECYGPWMIKVMKEVKKYAEARFLPEFDYQLDASKPIGFGHEKQPKVQASGSWMTK